MFEKKYHPVLDLQSFRLRMLRQMFFVVLAVGISLAVGVLGYHITEGMNWLDALLNASMILGGMGPVDTLHTDAGKWFASFYALYSGLFLIACGGVLLAPIFHRILHHFHAVGD
ncbi:MAG: hypothetical protein ACOYJ2_06365 [Rickettsiales bacterium]